MLTPLFSGGSLDEHLQGLRANLKHEIEQADKDYVLNVNEEEWADHLAERWSVQLPAVEMDPQNWVLDDKEARPSSMSSTSTSGGR